MTNEVLLRYEGYEDFEGFECFEGFVGFQNYCKDKTFGGPSQICKGIDLGGDWFEGLFWYWILYIVYRYRIKHLRKHLWGNWFGDFGQDPQYPQMNSPQMSYLYSMRGFWGLLDLWGYEIFEGFDGYEGF